MVLKTEIEKAYSLQKNFYHKAAIAHPRDKEEQLKLDKAYVLVITGVRRCGKSTLMHQLKKQQKANTAFFNFEDPRIFNFEPDDFPKLEEVIGQSTEYYFFDEIQNTEKWEIFIRHLHDQGKKICITGSNASLLSHELGTRLTGRNIQIELFPFSYNEFLGFLKKENNADSFREYLKLGGFPEHLKTLNKELLQQLFKDIIYRDILVRHGIRNAKTLISIAQYLISNVGKIYSLNSIKNTFSVGSTNSVANYVQWFEDSYLIFSLPRFSWSLKSIEKNPRKAYVIDTAFASVNSLSFSNDQGRMLENTVYLHLRRKHTELFYFREKGECDFIVKQGTTISLILQVCNDLHNENLDREVNGLLEAMDYFNKTEGYIITTDQKDELKKNGKMIHVLPAWEWLMKT